jgi:ornithine carbamoyltransferase
MQLFEAVAGLVHDIAQAHDAPLDGQVVFQQLQPVRDPLGRELVVVWHVASPASCLHCSIGSARQCRDNADRRCVTLGECRVSGGHQHESADVRLTPVNLGAGVPYTLAPFMNPLLNHRSLWTLDELSRRDVLALLDTARALKRAGRAGAAQRLLRGKNVAVLSDAAANAHANPFCRAACALGAHVAHIRPQDSGLTSGHDVSATARMLGRLYDAIECEGLDEAVLEALEQHAGVPVFNGLALPAHPTHALADLMTMAELGGKPLSQLQLCVSGHTPTGPGAALLRAARLAGMGVHDATHCTPPECDGDFVYDERNGALAFMPARGAGDTAGLAAERDENQQFALQAMLVSTIS